MDGTAHALVAVLALAGLCAGCLPLCAPAQAAEVSPVGRGARKYFAPPVEGSAREALSDPLARTIADLAARAALAHGHAAPVADWRLTAVAETLAETLGPDDVPGLELQEFLLSHFGLGDPLPELAMFQVGMDDDTIRTKYAARLPGLLQGGPFGRIGIGIVRRFLGRTSVVLALQRTDVELLPIPRQMASGDSALVAGRLLRGRRDPRIIVAPPKGDVAPLAVRGSADGFQGIFRCQAGNGRYQVEIVGSGREGKTVVANFPIYCGIEPPRAAEKALVAAPETTDVKQAEALALAAVNRDRVTAGLPGLVWDEALARAARSYSDELARRQVVEHVSLESGNAADRIRRAGVRALVVLENVGRANSVSDAHKSFLSSPGHRANVMARNVARIGIGISIKQEPKTLPTLYVTQLFAR